MVIKRVRALTPFALFGYVFLYVPILFLILFSFNESKMVTTWTGFSLKWYADLLSDSTVLGALWVSIRVAFMTATLALILGTLTAVVLVRMGRFRGRKVLGAISTMPLVLPDVIMGLSILLLLISLSQIIGWPTQRGILTITLAHTTLAFAYVVVIVRSRLLDFNQDLEEAALDLGAKPAYVFFTITLPLITPSLVSGWLIAFTLSLDDIVLSSFLSGPTATTLPMYIFSSIRFGLSPKINALATLMIGTVAIGVGIAGWLFYRYQNRDHLQKKGKTLDI